MSGRKTAAQRPPAKRPRKRRRQVDKKDPSLLEMLKEEEIAVAYEEFDLQPAKRRRQKELIRLDCKCTSDGKVGRLCAARPRANDNPLAQDLHLPKTEAHARKFRDLVDGFAEWKVQLSSTPPANALSRVPQSEITFFLEPWPSPTTT